MRVRFNVIVYFLFIGMVFTIFNNPATAENNIDFYEGPDIKHSVVYDVEGFISIDKTIGYSCLTGAEKKQTILGYGELTKIEDVRIVQNLMSNQDKVTWSVPANAVRGLTVTTTIDLCARPMMTAAENYVYLPDVFSPATLVYLQDAPQDFLKDLQAMINNDNFILKGDLISPYHPLVVAELVEARRKTEQVWGTRISTLPGHDGFYNVDFRAAYGPGPLEIAGLRIGLGRTIFFNPEYMWWFDDTKEDGYDSGRFYVGNYFHIDQHAYTSRGNMQRFISMSNPFENTYLVDRVNVTGQAEIKEAFSMEILEAGPDARTLLWHDLF